MQHAGEAECSPANITNNIRTYIKIVVHGAINIVYMCRREHQKIYTFYFLGLNVKLSSHTHMYSMLIIPVLLQIQQFLLKLKYHIRGNIGDNNNNYIDETQSIGRLNIDDLVKIYFIHALIYFILYIH